MIRIWTYVHGKKRYGKIVKGIADSNQDEGKETGLPVTAARYGQRLHHLTVGGEKAKELQEQHPKVVEMAKAQLKADYITDGGNLHYPWPATQHDFHKSLLVDAKHSQEKSIIVGAEETTSLSQGQ